MFWFHCKKATDKQLLKVLDDEKKSEIIQYIIALFQLSQTPSIFYV